MMACDMMARGACFGAPMGAFAASAPLPPPKLRKEFPETWLWDSISDDSFDGDWILKKKVPDTLTSWVLTGFSIDPVNGLGITKTPAKLKVFQPFFVSLNLPYSIKRGEIVTIPCNIFNYLDSDVDVEVILYNDYEEFEFVDAADNEEAPGENIQKKKLIICSDHAATANFRIKPTKVGPISLRVIANSPIAGDGVVKLLNVESEGVAQYVNKAVFVDLREKNTLDPVTVTVDIPKTALPDSNSVEIRCVGDLLGGTIKNLQNLIRLPYGCGEQNMLNFVPNIVVLNYLKNTQQLSSEVEAKAKKYMEIGYQRELTYKHDDGSFSAFGKNDDNGSTWLTAFVAKSFQQASSHIDIQQSIIDSALAWLSKSQAEDGSFLERGNICHKEMQGGAANGAALTAYVLTAFLECKVNSSSTYIPHYNFRYCYFASSVDKGRHLQGCD